MSGVNKDGGGGHQEHDPAPSPGGSLRLTVTPDNVVDLAVAFRQGADRLQRELAGLDNALTIESPWLGDPYSAWAMKKFNDHFVNNDKSLVNAVADMYQQCMDMHHALVKIADKYDKTEELNQQLVQGARPR